MRRMYRIGASRLIEPPGCYALYPGFYPFSCGVLNSDMNRQPHFDRPRSNGLRGLYRMRVGWGALACVFALAACGGGGDNAVGNATPAVPVGPDASTPGSSASVSRVEASLRLAAATPNGDARFGIAVSVAADGSTLRIGAPGESSPGLGLDAPIEVDASPLASGYGAVYLYGRSSDGRWSLQTFVKPSRRANGFGSAVDASDDDRILVIGAPGARRETRRDEFGFLESGVSTGRVFVFERGEVGAWRESANFESIQTRSLDRFGGALALSGDGSTLVVGAPGRRYGLVRDREDLREELTASGAFHVFVRNADGSWRETQFERAPFPDASDHFGSVLALSADASVLAVGAFGDDANATGIGGDERLADGAAQGAGVVYLYERGADGGFRRAANLKPLAQPALAAFGAALAIAADGRRIVVGGSSPSYSSAWVPELVGVDPEQFDLVPRGIVEVFERRDAGWAPVQTLQAPITERFWARFGSEVAMSADGSRLVVGMDRTPDRAGSAFVFEHDGSAYRLRAQVAPPAGAFGVGTQASCSADCRTVLFGAPQDRSAGGPAPSDSGAAYLLTID